MKRLFALLLALALVLTVLPLSVLAAPEAPNLPAYEIVDGILNVGYDYVSEWYVISDSQGAQICEDDVPDSGVIDLKAALGAQNAPFGTYHVTVFGWNEMVSEFEEPHILFDGDYAYTKPIPPSVWYDLYINDVQVTDVNQNDVLGNQVFSFDPDTATLTLNGRSTSYAVANVNLIDNQIDGLTVCVAQDTTLEITNDDDSYTFICSDGDLTLTGPGKLKLKGPGTGDVGAAIYMYGGDLTLDEARVFCTGMKRGLQGRGGSGNLAFNHSTFYALTMEGGKAICDFAAGGITRTDSIYVLPTYTTIKDETGTACNNSDVALEELKLRADSPYSVWIEDVPVTDANKDNILGGPTFTLDTDTWTLFVNYDYISYDDTVRYLIQSSNAANSLTVVPTKNVTLTGAAAPTIGSTQLIGCAGNLTIQGPYDLTLKCRPHVDGQYASGVTMLGASSGSNTLQIVDGSLTIKNATTGIEGRLLGYSALSVENSFLSIRNCTGKAVNFFRSGITLTDCAIVEPAGGQIVNLSTNSISDYNIVESDGTTVAKTVLIEPDVLCYGVKVDGHEVTDRNRLDVLGDGRVNFAFDGEHTLSVTGTYRTEAIEFFNSEQDPGSYYCNDLISNYGHDGLAIDMSNADLFAGYGDGTHLNFYSNPNVISAEQDTVVTGSGTMTAKYVTAGLPATAVKAGNNVTLTFRNADLTVLASSFGQEAAYGIVGSSGAKLIFDNVNMDITSSSGAVSGFGGGIELRNCYISYPEGGRISDDGKSIVNADGSKAKHVVIEPTEPGLGLRITGVEVTESNRNDVLGNGVFSYDGSGVLSVRGSYTGTGELDELTGLYDAYDIIRNAGVSDLEICFENPSTLTPFEQLYFMKAPQAGIRVSADTKITGEKSTYFTFTTDRAVAAVKVENGATLTVWETEIATTGNTGLGIVGSGTGETLQIYNSSVELTCPADTAAISGFSNMQLFNCHIVEPVGGYVSGGTVREPDGTPASRVVIHPGMIQDGYYLIGPGWNSDDFNDANRFAENPDIPGTYVLNTELTQGDQILVVHVTDGAIDAVYPPEGDGSEYTVDAAHSGNVTIYFKTTYDSAWSDFGGYIYIERKSPVNPFVDVAEGKYYYDSVLWAYYHDPRITGGTDDTHFSPNKTCTREQIVTFLWKAKGAPEPKSNENPFTDVKSNKFYYKAVLWAVENGITGGVTKTTFGVGQPCKREQAMTFLWKAMGSPGILSSTLNPFTDVKEGKYYYTAVLWAVENGVTGGTTKTTFGVGKTCTRGQIVTFLYKAFAN